MSTPGSANPPAPQWLSLKQASELLGVHHSTLRAWADQGQIGVFRTPGGHRRFRLADIQEFMQAQMPTVQSPPDVDRVMQTALGRVRREMDSPTVQQSRWRADLDETHRQSNRERGRRLFALALNYVMRPEQREEIVDNGRVLGKKYGVEAASNGVGLAETGRAVQFFRQQLLEAVRRDESLDPEDVQIRQALALFLDEVLYAVLEGYESVLMT